MTEPTKRPARRRHVAQRSRIVAAGLGATGMLGIVTLFGIQNPVSGSGSSAPAPVPPAAPIAPPVQVVIHRIPAAAATATPAVAPVADPSAAAAAQPVQLSARPVVRTVTSGSSSQPRSSGASSSTAGSASAPAPAPVAATGGSK